MKKIDPLAHFDFSFTRFLFKCRTTVSRKNLTASSCCWRSSSERSNPSMRRSSAIAFSISIVTPFGPVFLGGELSDDRIDKPHLVFDLIELEVVPTRFRRFDVTKFSFSSIAFPLTIESLSATFA